MKHVFVTLVPFYLAEVAVHFRELPWMEVRGKKTVWEALAELSDGFINHTGPKLIEIASRGNKGVDLVYRLRTTSRARPGGFDWRPLDDGFPPYDQSLISLALLMERP